jgi:quinol monooxygenase YgiN
MKIQVIARAVAVPGLEDSLRALLRGMLAPTHTEDGCELYDLYESHEPGRFYFYEIWTSKAHLDAHCQTSHFKHLEANITALIAEPLEINLVQKVV